MAREATITQEQINAAADAIRGGGTRQPLAPSARPSAAAAWPQCSSCCRSGKAGKCG